MMANPIVPRNGSCVDDLFNEWKGKWTEWHAVMRSTNSDGFEERKSSKGELLGYKANAKTLQKIFGDFDDGIYECKKIGPRGGNSEVLYVGKTSAKGDKSLLKEIQRHMGWQTHERESFNKVLRDENNLQFRVLPTERTSETPETMKAKVLKAYRYPWNDLKPSNSNSVLKSHPVCSDNKSRKPRNHLSILEELFVGWKGDWTDWYTVMRNTIADNFEKRASSKGELVGFKANLETLEKYFKKFDDGIYEWRKIGPRGGNIEVVYVGKTSSKSDDSLLRRIQCYMRWQSHEQKNINKALRDGFHLQVRVLPSTRTRVTAENMEIRALKAYSYAWNDMNQKDST